MRNRNAFLFPGQGGQEPGMGKELYETIVECKKILDTGCELLGYDIRRLMFEGSMDQLTDTRYAQPSIFLCSAMHLEKARLENVSYEYVAGHSLGEYSALYAAGVLTFEDALRLVDIRAKAMASENGKGTMAAIIGMDEEEVNTYVKNDTEVEIANLNTKLQIVISGTERGIASIEKALKDRIDSEEVKFKRLNVSAAFHSSQMENAAKMMEKEILTSKMEEPSVGFFSNVTGKMATSIDEIRTNLVKQMTGQVRWYDIILGMKDAGVEQYYEVGHGKVLKKMNKLITLKPRCENI